MRLAHFDAAAGASGDMILGALVDAGLAIDDLRADLAGLAVEGYTLSAERVKSRGIAATRVTVALAEVRQPHRHLRHILEILEASALPPEVREAAAGIFRRLAEAEAKVHDTTVEKIHFHEVGAVDAMVDVVGAVAGLRRLGVERVSCSPLPLSHGWVDCAHGRLPVPAYATLALLGGVPTVPLDVEGETLTPTGAAILTSLAESWGPPAMALERVGHGAGMKDYGVPNVLRLWLGEAAGQPAEVVVLETNLDDMNPEWYERAVQALFEAGALDVTLSPVQMKKGRPGVLLKVVGDPTTRERLAEVMLRETTTLGLRWYPAQRECLRREWREVETPFGRVRVKIGMRDGAVLNIAPEHESCRVVAESAGASLPDVYGAAREAARALLAGDPRRAAGRAS